MHASTQNVSLIQTFYELGLCPSYHRILDVSTSLGNNVCEFYQTKDVVCPPQLLRHQFTTAAVDNIDHNPSSTASTASFHGTCLSLFQNVDSDTDIKQTGPDFSPTTIIKSSRKLCDLPLTYTQIQPMGFNSDNVFHHNTGGQTTPNKDEVDAEMPVEFKWLDEVCTTVQNTYVNAEIVGCIPCKSPDWTKRMSFDKHNVAPVCRGS